MQRSHEQKLNKKEEYAAKNHEGMNIERVKTPQKGA